MRFTFHEWWLAADLQTGDYVNYNPIHAIICTLIQPSTPEDDKTDKVQGSLAAVLSPDDDNDIATIVAKKSSWEFTPAAISFNKIRYIVPMPAGSAGKWSWIGTGHLCRFVTMLTDTQDTCLIQSRIPRIHD